MPKPELIAHFELDSHGVPKTDDVNGLVHYWITLSIANPPEDTYAVTYHLHESYYEPSRESRRRASGFSEDITSYGDYTVQAKLRTKQRVQSLAAPLSRALVRGHGPRASKAVLEALKVIQDN